MNRTTNAQVFPFTANATAEAVSDQFDRSTFNKHFVQVACPNGDVVVNIQFSADGVNWVESGIVITGNDYVGIDMFVPYMQFTRDNTTHPVTVKLFSGWYNN